MRLRNLFVLALFALAPIAMLLPGSAMGVARLSEAAPLSNLDTRSGSVAPTAAQNRLVSKLGATASWTRFGTVQSLIRQRGGYLATGLKGSPADAARSFVRTNRALFRLSDDGVSRLDVVSDVRLTDTRAHAVLFRQRFGSLPAAQDGMITVGIVEGKIAYASSSAAGDQKLTNSSSLSATAAWQKAAANAGVAAGAISNLRSKDGWSLFDVSGLGVQRARLVALPTVKDGARRAWEANVVDLRGEQIAYTAFVDAQTGAVLFRQNRVDYLAQAPQVFTFSGTYSATECGAYHGPYTAGADTKSIDVVASATNPVNDIVLQLLDASKNVVAASDVLFSPEAVHYEPAVFVPGDYYVRVCPFDDTELLPPPTYAGAITINDLVGTTTPLDLVPRWKFFTANPPLDGSDTDTRVVGCWVSSIQGTPIPGCELELQNPAARSPWDFDPLTNAPSFTTRGNGANSAEAWLSPLTPAEHYQPLSPTRQYVFPWTDQWRNTGCSPTVFTSPQRNDIDAASANLFAMHNRMHDWSYFLGFTETTWNLQESNFGNPGRGGDPELGDAQAGALTGGNPSFLGRDNANQITLQDGVPPITNMYLWQPIAAAFYPPCVDGDYDMSVIGHEYTHAISNRMVGGPDAGLTGLQAGSMGESWSDLDAEEYLHEYGYVPTNGESPWAVGPYATGNMQKGIRDYALDQNPLNYSEVGFDVTGPEVHADGEIWNAVNYDLRQALVTKYNAQFPASDAALQRRCADGKLPADHCPGNRRWIQIVYDAWLMMQPAVSMVDARDAYLAADQLRFGGANRVELWREFARRGLGQFASSTTNTDSDPVPSFETPAESNEATVTFRAVAADEGGHAVRANVYVGQYEARSTPYADTDPATARPATVKLVPGRYDFVAQAKGYGLFRTSATLTSGGRTITFSLPTNWASRWKGAEATGDGVNHTALIDDTEGTDWAVLARSPSVGGAQVTVELAGGRHVVRNVRVSAMLRPANANDANDPGSQSRFSALRQFEIWTCDESLANAKCTAPDAFQKIYTSPADAFPGVAPRPVAPDLILRTFDVPDTTATHVRLVVVSNQCTGGSDFQGEQDSDPVNVTDCSKGSAQDQNVRAAELEVLSR